MFEDIYSQTRLQRRAPSWLCSFIPVKWPLTGRESDLGRCMDLIQSGTGVALLGPAGVGKSRLLHELGDKAESTGMPVIRVVAAESTRSIPFAPFVELLPGVPTQDRLVMVGRALETLQARSAPTGLVLAVDEAHNLDEGSLALLINAVNNGLTSVVLTARSGETMPSDLVDMWTNGVLQRIDLDPLDREATRAMLHARLGPVDDELGDEVWRLSQGNPLLVHELIEGAIGKTIERNADGTWVQAGTVATSPRLADLLNSRLATLPESTRWAMELVAIGAPVSLETLSMAAADELAELDNRGLVRTMPGISGGTKVLPAHPMYGEILTANVGADRFRRANRVLVKAAIDAGRLGDALQVAMWQHHCGEIIDQELALAGATEALIRHDPGLAERLIGTMNTDDARVAVILGRSLSYQQRFEEAEEVLSGSFVGDPDLLGELASVRGQNLAFGLVRIDEARTVINEGVDRAGSPMLKARLLNERAMVAAISGDFVDARSTTERVLADPAADDVARAAAYVTLTVAQAMTGDCDALESMIDDAVATAAAVHSVLPFAEDQILVMHESTMISAGRLAEAVSLGEARGPDAAGGGAFAATWLSALSTALDPTGRHKTTVACARRAVDLFTEADPFGLELQARGVISLGLGQLGDPSAGLALEGVALEVPAPRLSVWVNRGRAWSAVVEGDLDRAVEILVAAGENAADREHFAWAALCFHDAARLGHPDRVVDRLRSLPEMPGARLVDALRHQVDSLTTGPIEGVVSAAANLASMGASLLAAEAFAQAASLTLEADPVESARLVLLSKACELRCEEPRTPALAMRPTLVSDREAQIAVDAEAGLTSPQIAKKLFISVRTVDNHLHSVYRQLELNGRSELAELFSSIQPA